MKITKKEIDRIFQNYETAKKYKNRYSGQEILESIYRLVIPDLHKIKKMEGWPKSSEEMNHYIFDKFIDYDQKYLDKSYFKGGLWLNRGFSVKESLKHDQVIPPNVKY
jgi:hypothetical protein